MADSCEFCNERSGSIICGEVLGELRRCQLLRKHSAPLSQY